MPYDDENEIVKMVDARDLELKELKNRFESDYKSWRLTPFQLGKSADEYDNYTSSWPRNKADKITQILGYAPLKISIPKEDDKEQERKDKDTAERLIYGAFNLADERLSATVQPTVQQQTAWYSVNRGWVVWRFFVHFDDDGNLIVDIAIWDPLNTVWEVCPKGLLWACHKRPITKAQAEAEYNKNLGEKPVIYDFWDNEKYKVIGNGETLLGDKHDLDHIPIFIGMVGPAPFIQSGEFQDTIKDFGESVYASDRSLIPIINKLMTFRLTIIGQGAHNPLAIYSAGGRKSLEKSPYRRGSDVRLDTDKNEKIEPLFQPVMPKDTDPAMNVIQQELTMSGAISLLWGIDEAGGSGYRANLLTHAASTVLLPPQRLMEQAYEWGARETLTQYKSGEFGKTRVRGRDNRGKKFDLELSPSDIKGDWYPDAELQPSLPFDEAAKITMLKTAIDAGIYSGETAMEKAGIQDVETEKERRWRAFADQDEYIRAMKIVKSLKDDGRPDLARQYWDDFLKRHPQQGGNGASKNMPSFVVPPAETETQLPPDEAQRMREELKLKALGLEGAR
jgi:hypothetical protein